jgi:hypothetical protein
MMQIAEKIHEIDSYEFSGTQDPARVAQALPSRPPVRASRTLAHRSAAPPAGRAERGGIDPRRFPPAYGLETRTA